jgi:hypothetical protein
MFKILAKIFNPKKLGDSIISGVDKAILTNEEKIDYMQKMLTLYEPYKLAQRILAILFSSVFLLIHLLTAIAHFIYVLRDLNTEKVISLYSYNNDSLGMIVLMVVSFYFAGGVLEGTVKRLKQPNSDKK